MILLAAFASPGFASLSRRAIARANGAPRSGASSRGGQPPSARELTRADLRASLEDINADFFCQNESQEMER